MNAAPRHAWAVGFLALLWTGCSPETGAVVEPPRHVVLIVLDTLRPDHLEAYGYPRRTAPFLSSLAARSVFFSRAYSTSSWTAPATASVFTGLYPTRHGVLKGFHAQRREGAPGHAEPSMELVALPPTVATLPELFQEAGFRTFGVAANVNIGGELGFDRGFELFGRDREDSARELVDEVLGWRRRLEPGERSFLYVHFNDTHMPYRERLPWYEKQAHWYQDVLARYDSEISYLDEALERLHREMGWADDTALMIVSDHGEEFLEHGWKGHSFSLHVELNRVLMILDTPEFAGRGLPVPVHVSLVDVLPTLLDLAGIEAGAEVDGRSLVPLVRAELQRRTLTAFEARTLFAHRQSEKDGQVLWAAMRERWRLIEKNDGSPQLLFDVETDPAEQTNVIESFPEVARGLQRDLAAFQRESARALAEASRHSPKVGVKLDDALFEHLSVLGYTGDRDPETQGTDP